MPPFRVSDDAPVLHVDGVGGGMFEPGSRIEYGALAVCPMPVAMEMPEYQGLCFW